LKLKLTVDGKVYEVDVEVAEDEPPHPSYVPPLTHGRPGGPLVAPPGSQTTIVSPSSPVADEGKVCRSPFAGTVVRVEAKVGQSIQVNDVLLVIEAMKMETVITAPVAGKVSEVNVHVGDAVQQGQVLVVFE
jgi:methylmalonyl-CoA carboxyltransferase small subunit